MSDFELDKNIFSKNVKKETTRIGFGEGLKQAGQENKNVIALCADLTESTHMHFFRDSFSDRFIQTGIAEQNLVTLASGLARAGKIPFTSSYAAFSPGRNWEQIRTTICLNDQPVKIIGSHAGLSVGPDGATHQMLEDIGLMRVLPNMVVIAPGDSIEARKATLKIAFNNKPSYLRLARADTPIFTTIDSPFEIGKAYVLKKGEDITLIGTGVMSYQLLLAADILRSSNIDAEVIHSPTIKPLDEKTIIDSARKTKLVVTAEEGQINCGFGSKVSECLSEALPTFVKKIGIYDRFGESGEPDELMSHFGLTSDKIADQIIELYHKVKR